MTSANEAANGQPEAKSTAASGKQTTSKSSRSKAKAEASIVKAEEQNSEVFVLDDNTRIVETDSLPNHRPIALSEFTVVGNLGARPIMADTFEVYATDLLPGHRPVAISTLPISDLNFLPGNRPIAPNDVVDPPGAVLMGYLD
ncbi:MAG: hypothetical protein AAFX01_04995 [Cyanobacteria bacterium J06638_28]